MTKNLNWREVATCGNLSIWEGTPHGGSPSGSWVVYEVRNASTGETRSCDARNVATTMNDMESIKEES